MRKDWLPNEEARFLRAEGIYQLCDDCASHKSFVYLNNQKKSGGVTQFMTYLCICGDILLI